MKRLSVLSLLSFFVLIAEALAEEQKQVDVTEIPYWLGVQLNVGTFAGGIIASAVLLIIVLMPFIILTKGKAMFAQVAIIFLVMGMEIAIGWLPFWFLVMLVVLTVGLFAKTIVDKVGG